MLARSILALLLVLTTVQAQTTTKGLKLDHAPGYTFGSNVYGYLRLSTDVCDIKKAIGDSMTAPRYAAAQKIYTSGLNSLKSDGSLRTLRGLATDSYAGEPIWDLYVRYFGSDKFLDAPVMAAFAGTAPYRTVPQRNQTIVKGVESAIQTVYFLHELDETVPKIRARSLSVDKGAPHQIDETFAIWAGLTPACSLWGAANKRGSEFGTMADCSTSRVNAGITQAHRRMYAASVKGDLAAYSAAQREAQRQVLILGIQNTLKYSELMDKAAAKKDTAALQDEQAEGAMFFRTIAPLIARANADSARVITQVLTVGAPVPPSALAIVRPALERTYAGLGISRADVGAFGAKPAIAC